MFTAWGKEANGLQAGLGFCPGEHWVYHDWGMVTLVVRVRNVGNLPRTYVGHRGRILFPLGDSRNDFCGFGREMGRAWRIGQPSEVSPGTCLSLLSPLTIHR